MLKLLLIVAVFFSQLCELIEFFSKIQLAAVGGIEPVTDLCQHGRLRRGVFSGTSGQHHSGGVGNVFKQYVFFFYGTHIDLSL